MIIVADESIPYAEQAFGQFGEVRILHGRAIGRDSLRDVDVLFVRSITRVDRTLLDGTSVRFVGSATSGIDHVDEAFLRHASIAFASAPGSNANSVAEYVVAALLELYAHGVLAVANQSIGIVGVGAIGAIVSRFARAMGMRVFEYDPPRALRDPTFLSTPFEQILECDVITLHVPLIRDGAHRTHHMFNAAVFGRTRRGCVLINTSRGDVVDSVALTECLKRTSTQCVLDVWEGEPTVPGDLVERATICTPHIAGYSADGKCRGTIAMMQSLAQWSRRDESTLRFSFLSDARCIVDTTAEADGMPTLRRAVAAAYDIAIDNRDMRALLKLDGVDRRARFDQLRRDYRIRREFSSYQVVANNRRDRTVLMCVGFGIADSAHMDGAVE